MADITPLSDKSIQSAYRYQELADILRRKISTLSSGTRLPSVRSLMKRYKLSLQTVSSAVQVLEDEGLVLSRRGSGVYVSEQRARKLIIFHRSHYPSVYEDMKEMCLHKEVLAEGWHLSVRRHESIHGEIGDDLNPEPKACAHILAQDVGNRNFEFLHQLYRQEVPVILLDREAGGMASDGVSMNERQQVSLLVKHLVSLGHKQFGLLVNEPHYIEVEERVDLFKETLELFDLPPGQIIDCRTEPGESSFEMAYLGLKKFLEDVTELPFTALITSSAAGGFPALRALHEQRIAVPDQCSVACCGYDPNNLYQIPSITDAGSPAELWGKWIVKALRLRFANPSSPVRSLKIPAELFLRESTAPVPASRSLIGKRVQRKSPGKFSAAKGRLSPARKRCSHR